MPLRRKALLILSLTGLGLAGSLLLIFSVFWLSNTSRLEQEQGQQNVHQMTQAIEGELLALDRLVSDWAGWDDTYQFVLDHNSEYIDSNLTPETYSKDQLSAVFVIDLAGQIVYSQTYDYEAGTALPFSPQWAAYLPTLTHHPNITSSIKGTVLLDQLPILVASRPILNSNYQGPIRGTLIMGRALNDKQIQHLAQVAGLQLEFLPASTQPLPPDFEQAYRALYRPGVAPSEKEIPAFYSTPADAQTLSSYGLTNDLLGQPALLLRAQTPRQIFEQVQNSIGLITVSLLLTFLVFGSLTILLLDRTLLRRLARLEASVTAIKTSGDLSARVPVTGRDELAQLATRVNEMLAALAQAEQDNARLYQETRRQLNELTLLHTAAMTAANSLTLDEALQHLAQSTTDAFNAINTMVILRDLPDTALKVRASVGVSAEVLAACHFVEGAGIIGTVAQTGQALLINDTRRDPRYTDADTRTRSELCAPLKTGGRVIGVINVESDRLDAFTPADLQLLQTLAHNLSTIIENLRLLEELRAANDELQKIDRLKSRFFANMSHELRTPLNSVLGFSELLTDEMAGPLNTEQLNYVQHINTSGQHLLELINDILDFSKLQAGRLTLDQRSFCLSDVWRDVWPLIGSLVQRKQQALHVEIPLDLPGIYADPLRVKQVLVNLLNNASKFTPPGGTLTVSAEMWQTAWLRVSVSDTGPGIPPDQQVEVFEEFSQLNQKYTTGSGLGLPIARRLIELHGGQLWVDSTGQPGEGSTFCFTLPLSAGMDAHHASTRLLIVDDEPLMIEILKSILLPPEFEVAATTDVYAVRDRIIKDAPDMIALDLPMPDVDWIEFLTMLRQHPATQQVAVLALIAQPLNATEQAAADQLVQGAIHKQQLRRETLLAELRRMRATACQNKTEQSA